MEANKIKIRLQTTHRDDPAEWGYNDHPREKRRPIRPLAVGLHGQDRTGSKPVSDHSNRCQNPETKMFRVSDL
jgi:hypothetical protein